MVDAVQLVPGRPDAEVAADLKNRMQAALIPVLTLMDEATAGGFIAQFQLGMGTFGKNVVQGITLSKQF